MILNILTIKLTKDFLERICSRKNKNYRYYVFPSFEKIMLFCEMNFRKTEKVFRKFYLNIYANYQMCVENYIR